MDYFPATTFSKNKNATTSPSPATDELTCPIFHTPSAQQLAEMSQGAKSTHIVFKQHIRTHGTYYYEMNVKKESKAKCI